MLAMEMSATIKKVVIFVFLWILRFASFGMADVLCRIMSWTGSGNIYCLFGIPNLDPRNE